MARSFTRGARMSKDWGSIPGSQFSLVSSSVNVIASVAPGVSATVIRMLGEYIIGPRIAPVAQDEAAITLAIGVVSTDAFTVGGSAMPDPADADFPWMFWASHSFFFGTTTVDPSSSQASLRRSFDVRSMRKMKAQESLVFVVQYVDIAGAPPLKVNLAQTRVLFAGL